MIVVSTGCPAGIGPEVSVAARLRSVPCVLVGDARTLHMAAELVGVSRRRFVPFASAAPAPGKIAVYQAGPVLRPAERRPGRPSRVAGAAQLAYVNAAFQLARERPGRALVTGPVSKSVIATSGAPGAAQFRGHTEWLRDQDGAKHSIMCFVSRRLATSLVTTHLPLGEVPRSLTPEGVSQAVVWLARLLRALGKRRPLLAVAALNPHAGEDRLFGQEESFAIVPGMALAQRRLRRSALLFGPIGAETAFRKAYLGHYDGVVAMYHDQATIATKLVAFGDAVNVTMGLSVVRTSVDHGTAYDIAWQKRASPAGMASAMRLGARLAGARELRGRAR
jgi:4-hydroxythreonine-4-phosphate dehydrogenase